MVPLWTTLAGVLIITWTLREVFSDLFQPSASGSLSAFVGARIFKLLKRVPSWLPAAGPLTIVVVISTWALLIASGFALIYWSRFPGAFAGVSTESHDPFHRIVSSLYFSLATLSTLGAGEIQPSGGWIRIVTGFEGLIGASLVTASTTWIVLIYPALGRMRSLSRFSTILVEAAKRTGIDPTAGDAEGLLVDLTGHVIRVRVDLIHFPLIYYFHGDTEGASLAKSLQMLTKLAQTAATDDRPQRVRLAAAMLQVALNDIAQLFASRFVRDQDAKNTEAVLQAVARDHLRSR
jgi:Ion channel